MENYMEFIQTHSRIKPVRFFWTRRIIALLAFLKIFGVVVVAQIAPPTFEIYETIFSSVSQEYYFIDADPSVQPDNRIPLILVHGIDAKQAYGQYESPPGN